MSDDAFAELRRWHETTGNAHTSLLRWVRSVGYARHDGVGADIYEPPAVAPEAQDITYLPHEAWIDGVQMTPEQMTETRRLLVQMASDARDAITGQSTLVVAFEREKSA